MRGSRPLFVFSQLALLTLALVSCGGQSVPNAGTADGTASAATQPLRVSGEIVTVRVRPGTTQADLLSRYPGAEVLALHPEEGYAQVLTSGAASETPTLSSLSLNAQAVSVVSTEADSVVVADTAMAQGNTAWAGGNTAWAGGNTAWAGGTTAGGAGALDANSTIWNKLDLGTAQKTAFGLGSGVHVAVLDTGIDINHPAFAGHLNVQWGWDYVGGDATPQEENWATSGFSKSFGHGTAVAGVILQVAPNATIVPYRVLNPNGAGRVSDIIRAITDATSKGIKVINLSLGTTTPSISLLSAVSTAVRSGVMVVSSSGNTGDQSVTYPAHYTADLQQSLGGGVLSVGSVSALDRKSAFSTYGPDIDVVAPGESVATAFPNNQRTFATGTSFAAPLVSGVVALAVSNGRSDVVALYKSLKATVTASADTTYLSGKGVLNAGKLMVTK